MSSFYPDIKKHISPSAFDSWHHGRGSFIRSYFLGEKSPETAAMKSGKKIHALIEAGVLEVKHRYEHKEKTLTQPVIEESPVNVLGIPDSYQLKGDQAFFVDYKSGKENTWDATRLAGDLKMKLTAWLVWHATGKPQTVHGFIEYVPTQWNPATREVEPTEGESQVAAEFAYTADELDAFTMVILGTIKEVNDAYDEWLESSDDFINQDDVTRYAELDQQVREAEMEMGIIKERIGDQMKMGSKQTIAMPMGSFYFTTKKKYDYPDSLRVTLPDGLITTYGEIKPAFEQLDACMASSKKKFETENKPVSETRTLSFRAKK